MSSLIKTDSVTIGRKVTSHCPSVLNAHNTYCYGNAIPMRNCFIRTLLVGSHAVLWAENMSVLHLMTLVHDNRVPYLQSAYHLVHACQFKSSARTLLVWI